ncbi:MAG: amino acid ABC transporter permease [Anaerolineales bacterium]|nr:amino acid ABC transporter permease [Anaerolineales bacterium]
MSTEQPAAIEPPRAARVAPTLDTISRWPWWLLITILVGLLIVFQIVTDAQTNVIFRAISTGALVTFRVSLASYALAVCIGLLVGLARVSSNVLIFNLSSFYVEVIRGVPILVLLLYISFVGVPGLVAILNAIGAALSGLLGPANFLLAVGTRDLSFEVRAMIALGVAYGAFEGEIFRAGIQSIEKGQMEAARGMGMNYLQAMRHVILPQAIRRVLPALGNDFVAMVKDSSLVSVLGVRDMTQITKLYAASTFLYFQAYSILAFMYLVLTILLTRGVRALEARLSRYRY